LLGRPPQDAVPAVDPDPSSRVVRLELSAGLPVRIDLDPALGLVLAVPLGVAGAVIAADPSAVVFDTGSDTGTGTAAAPRDCGAAWPRLSLVVNGGIGETVPVVLGVPFRVAGPAGAAAPPGPAAVEVIVDELVLAAGSLRGPGRFGSRLSLRWRDLTLAPDAGPPPPLGDAGIPGSAGG
jgi:hypothetical protein